MDNILEAGPTIASDFEVANIEFTQGCGARYQLTGERLQRYMSYVRHCLEVAQAHGVPLANYDQGAWEKVPEEDRPRLRNLLERALPLVYLAIIHAPDSKDRKTAVAWEQEARKVLAGKTND